ncbi:DUF5004 domain-containing protein [Chryseobacterium sp. KACC 21268]|nr:DUF5004 domain-containing protein [Chryseobacterium sp. KACC 21268]
MIKKLILSLMLAVFIGVSGQTSQELFGKWQLVKWVKNGQEKDIQSYFKTDQVFQIFHDDRTFESLVAGESHKGKWHFSKDNTELTMTSALLPVTFRIDSFDTDRRVMTYKDLGTFTYLKVKEPEQIK